MRVGLFKIPDSVAVTPYTKTESQDKFKERARPVMSQLVGSAKCFSDFRILIPMSHNLSI